MTVQLAVESDDGLKVNAKSFQLTKSCLLMLLILVLSIASVGGVIVRIWVNRMTSETVP